MVALSGSRYQTHLSEESFLDPDIVETSLSRKVGFQAGDCFRYYKQGWFGTRTPYPAPPLKLLVLGVPYPQAGLGPVLDFGMYFLLSRFTVPRYLSTQFQAF